MRFGLHLPQFNEFGDIHLLVQLARECEEAGWDGFFLWDHILFDDLSRPMVDPWVALSAVAAATRRIRLGTMLTPLARRRPWKLARETVSLDHLSGGRLTLGVGLGDPARWEFGFFNEDAGARVRAEKLDEGLQVLAGLWSGQPFRFQGRHYQLEEMTFLPPPLQTPRIPIWVGGYWPNQAPFKRAARYDGIFPHGSGDRELTPGDWRDILAYIARFRDSSDPFDAVHGGVTPGDDPGETSRRAAAYAQAGVTWWLEDISPYGRWSLPWDQPWPPGAVDRLRARIHQGPPRID